MIVGNVAQFLTSRLGSQLTLAYLAVVVLGAAVLSLSARSASLPTRRLGATFSLLILRLILIAAWWAAASLAPSLAGSLPGLERFVGLVALFLFAWALLADRSPAVADPALAAAVLLVMVGLFLTLLIPAAGGSFNRSPADAAWTVLGLLVSSAATVALSARSARASLAAVGMGLLAAGFALHLLLGPAGEDFPAFLRLGEILSYPILCLALIGLPRPVAGGPQAASSLPPEAAAPLPPGILIELVGLGLAEDSRDLSRRLVRALARALHAEIVLLLTPPDDAGRFAIAGGYDLIQEREVEGASLDDRQSPVLGAALAHRRPASLPGRSRSPDMGALRGALNLRSAGPAVLAPLECDGHMFGGVLLLSPYTRQEWTEDQKRTLFGVAPLISRKLLALEAAASETLMEAGSAVEAAEASGEAHGFAASMPTRPEPAPGSDGHAAMADATPTPTGALRKTRMQTAIAAGPRATDSGQFQRVAIELQLALQELAETRSRLRQDGVEAAPTGREEVATIARNLRQPITSGLGYTDLILGESVGLLGAMQRKFLERVRDGLRKADEQLLELSLAAYAAESMPLPAANPIELGRCLDDALARASGGLRDRGQSLHFEIPEGMRALLVEGDAVTQVIEHLVAHASRVSYSSADLELGARTQPPESATFLHLWVIDQGPGLAPADYGTVFRESEGGESGGTANETEGGDLQIVRAMTEAAGGRVWVEASLGSGSTVSVLLPIPAAPPAAEPGPPS